MVQMDTREGGRGYSSSNRGGGLIIEVGDIGGGRGRRGRGRGYYSNVPGSHDQTVRVWNCQTGECEATTQVGGEVDSMLMQAGFLFIGVRTVQGQGQIKAWNMSNNVAADLGRPSDQWKPGW